MELLLIGCAVLVLGAVANLVYRLFEPILPAAGEKGQGSKEREKETVRYLSPEDKEVSAENKTLSDPFIVQYYPGQSPVRFESSQKEERW